ncbi:peptide deformylase [Marinicella litoralis]|uniref:Peptide deformylase n=1 Tax=Marinicella litoralis TaxID=644220 RepID=A0A4R6Y0Y1_9GAMM|nr:peptide deformylase [Marinicella litoralis]TDR23793.1 peptide deformylase [Marinicella litoralis]
MSILSILTLPDQRLKTVAKPVIQFDQALETLAADMLETMYAAPGIGLAATQVDQHVQLVVLDVSEDNSDPMVLVNPVITEKDGIQSHEEGCLSVPGIYASVKRAEQIKVDYQDLQGEHHQLAASGLLAVCIQHELDHLKGIVFLDHLSLLKRKLAIKKLEKAAL